MKILTWLAMAGCGVVWAGAGVTLSMRAEPRTFNPVVAIDNPSRELARFAHADLVHINRETLRTEAALAESWKVARDGKRIDVRLRRGLRFSDGAPFTAADVLFTFRVYQDEKVGSPQRDLLQVGGQPVRVTQTGEWEVRFEFAAAYAPAERIFDSIFVLPRHRLEEAYRKGELTGAWRISGDPGGMAGMGPFRLVSYKPGERAVYARNPHYWKKARPGAAGELTVRFLADAEAEALAFRSGAIDLISRIPAATYEALAGELRPRGYQFHDGGPGLEYHFLVFNQNTGGRTPEAVRARQRWYRSARFRRAVSLAADRESVKRLVYGGKAAAIWQPVSPGNRAWHNGGLPRPAMDVEAARRLLAEDGFRWRGDGTLVDGAGEAVTFSVAYNAANGQHMRMATLLQQDLGRLGIRVVTAGQEFRSLIDRVMNTRNYDAAILALAPGDADPGPEMSVWLTTGRSHVWNLEPARVEEWERRVDGLMRGQMEAVDGKARWKMYAETQALLQEAMPLICLVSPHILTAAKPGLGPLRRGIVPPYALDSIDELGWEGKR